MAKRLTREQKREQAVIDLINQMFIIAGHQVTYDDIKGRQDNWFQEWTMTVEQANEWKAWGVKYLREKLKMKKVLAEREMLWVNLQWGLKYSNWEEWEQNLN
jgi:hypothetical protein